MNSTPVDLGVLTFIMDSHNKICLFFPDRVLSTTDSSNQVTIIAEEDLDLLIFYLDFPSDGTAVVHHYA